jgi:hypothetical protein
MARIKYALACVALTVEIAFANVTPTPKLCTGGNDLRALVASAGAFRDMLSADERARLEKPFDRAHAIHWSNLPLGVVPRDGLRLGDLDASKTSAARKLLAEAFTNCGLTLLDDVRAADDALIPLDTRKIGWDGRNYFLTFLGAPSHDKAWMLQVGGHHLAST